ncbi:MAG: MlaA family lipoprotein, partial [Pseudomonadota bacterium]
MPRLSAALLLLPALLTLGGCASTGDPAGGESEIDPLEPYNRAVYRFNRTADEWVLAPAARGYVAITPDPVDTGVTNVFRNLEDVGNLVNNALQGKMDRAVSDLGRIGFNTTAGLLGVFDVATPLGFERHDEDFGQTLGWWGVPAGPYFVLPLLGPSTVRDTAGRGGDYFVSPYDYLTLTTRQAYALYAVRAVDFRASLLGTDRLLDQASFDPYAFQRDAWLQRRRNQVYDGEPPTVNED